MSMKHRLRQLEQAAAPAPDQQTVIYDPSELLRARDRWLRGEGPEPPDPPCPNWIDPAHYRHCVRFGKALSMHLAGWADETGQLPGEYNAFLPTARVMTDALQKCEHLRDPDHIQAVDRLLGRPSANGDENE